MGDALASATANAVTIRRATRGDADAVAALWHDFMAEQGALDVRLAPSADAARLWRATLREAWDDGVLEIWVAVAGETGGQADLPVIGFVVAEPFHASPVYADAAEVHIGELYVRPEARRGGVAIRLLDAVAASSRDRGAARVRFGVAWGNAAARALVVRWGAAPLAVTYTRDV